jgi:hypothetical protein
VDQRWRTLLDARASALTDQQAAKTNVLTQRLASLRKRFADDFLATLYAQFDTFPIDVAVRENVALIERLIERDTAALQQMVREVTPEEAGAVIAYFERDIDLWKQLIHDLEEFDWPGKAQPDIPVKVQRQAGD